MNNSGRELDDSDVSDIGTRDTQLMANRLLAAMKHPDCPSFMLDREASKLARFLAIRYYYLRSGNR